MKVLLVDDVHECLPEGLIQAGHEVIYLPDANREEILDHLPGMQVLVIRTKTRVDKELMNCGLSLRVIARAGAGLDNIDLEEAEKRGVLCINAGEANADAVGEHALGMLLMLLNKLGIAHQQVKQGIWLREANRGTELFGKTVAIIGYGNTGRAFAHKLRGMGVKVLAYDKYLQGYGNEWVKESSWEEIYAECDVLSFHVPLHAETQYYLNATRLAQFKKSIYVLNLSRGKVVNQVDLILGLEQEKVLGCALDVLENEKIENLNKEEKDHFEFLAGNEKVILTPHIGGWTKESYFKISRVLLDKLLTFSHKI